MNLVATCCILFAFLSLSGCLHSVRLPDAADREAIQAGDKAVVLLRHQSTYDSKPRQTLGTFPMEGFHFEMASLDEGKPLAPVLASTSPSEQARKDGWVILLLKPGSYYLSFARAGADQNPPATIWISQLGRWGHLSGKTIDLDRAYWFHVPRGSGVVYIGSFSNVCRTGRGIFGNLIDQCTEVAVRDEAESARSIAAEHFKEYGPLRTFLVREYSPALEIPLEALRGYRWNPNHVGYDSAIDPRYLAKISTAAPLPDSAGAPYPMGFAVAGGPEIIFPEWQKEAVKGAVTMGGFLEDARDLGGGYPPGAIAAAYLMFYLPPATLLGALWGDWKDRKWRPCAERLVSEMSEARPLKQAGEALLSVAPPGSGKLLAGAETVEELFTSAGRDQLRSLIKLELTRVSLMECGPDDSVSLDMSFRWRLWDAASRALLQERIYNFSSPSGRAANAGFYAARPYELFLPESPACKPMEQLCTEQGYAEFRQEMEQGIRGAARHILR